MARYSVTGKTAATAVTIDHAIAQIWNASTSKRLWVREIHVFKQAVGAADEPVIRRSTARGTAGSTVTPGTIQEREQIAVPPSGFLLDLAAFTVQPTLAGTQATGSLESAVIPAAIGAGIMWSWQEPWEVPAGQGLVVTTGIALAFPVSRVTFRVED